MKKLSRLGLPLFVFTLFLSSSFAQGSSQCDIRDFKCKRELVKKRSPENYFAYGINDNQESCLVTFDVYARNRRRQSSPVMKAVTAPIMEINIFTMPQNSSAKQVKVFGLWNTNGGRSGCPMIDVDTRDALKVWTADTAGWPCFARSSRLGASGSFILEKVINPRNPVDPTKNFLKVSISGNRNRPYTSCTVYNNKFFR